MNILRFVGSAKWLLTWTVLVFSIVPAVAKTHICSPQIKNQGREVDGNSLSLYSRVEIPEATEPGTPEVLKWWDQVRTAGKDVNRKRDKKSVTKFLLLVREGQQKAYRIPVKDRLPLLLSVGQLSLSEAAETAKITGKVVVSAEIKADGTVGSVEIVQRVGFGIDERVVHATRESIFLPAIESGAFVTARRTAVTEFSGPLNRTKASKRN